MSMADLKSIVAQNAAKPGRDPWRRPQWDERNPDRATEDAATLEAAVFSSPQPALGPENPKEQDEIS